MNQSSHLWRHFLSSWCLWESLWGFSLIFSLPSFLRQNQRPCLNTIASFQLFPYGWSHLKFFSLELKSVYALSRHYVYFFFYKNTFLINVLVTKDLFLIRDFLIYVNGKVVLTKVAVRVYIRSKNWLFLRTLRQSRIYWGINMDLKRLKKYFKGNKSKGFNITYIAKPYSLKLEI